MHNAYYTRPRIELVTFALVNKHSTIELTLDSIHYNAFKPLSIFLILSLTVEMVNRYG